MKFKKVVLVVTTAALVCCGCGSIVNDKTYITEVEFYAVHGDSYSVELDDDSTTLEYSEIVGDRITTYKYKTAKYVRSEILNSAKAMDKVMTLKGVPRFEAYKNRGDDDCIITVDTAEKGEAFSRKESSTTFASPDDYPGELKELYNGCLSFWKDKSITEMGQRIRSIDIMKGVDNDQSYSISIDPDDNEVTIEDGKEFKERLTSLTPEEVLNDKTVKSFCDPTHETKDRIGDSGYEIRVYCTDDRDEEGYIQSFDIIVDADDADAKELYEKCKEWHAAGKVL